MARYKLNSNQRRLIDMLLEAHRITPGERSRLVLLDDAERGLDDALAGRVTSEDRFRERLRHPSDSAK
jgi:hypothetical protein